MDDVHDDPALRDFNGALASVGKGTFLFDYDGTLAPFAVDVAHVQPYPGAVEAVDALMSTRQARVIIVTGRYLTANPPPLPTEKRPEIWGSHGRERLLPDGRYEVAELNGLTLKALTIADGWQVEVEAAGGRCETKPGSLAFHWRGAAPSQVARIRGIVETNFHREAFEGLLEIRNFDGGIELRAPGHDKGSVVRKILAELDPGVPVTYLGDDLTDEDAFRALRGRGLAVLVRPQFRITAADLWVRPPQQLLWLLNFWRTVLVGTK